MSNLPSKDYALFHLSTIQYYLGSFPQIIDHDQFQEQTERFYENPADEANQSRFWYSRFLFALAFGEAFTQMGSSKVIPGIISYPNHRVNGKEPVSGS